MFRLGYRLTHTRYLSVYLYSCGTFSRYLLYFWLKIMVLEFLFSLTQGLLLGLGTCFSYIPAVTVTPGWYDKRRALAMGIVLSG